MIIILWKTSDDRKHYRTFGRAETFVTAFPDNDVETLKEAEKFCKKLWQDSVVKGTKDEAFKVETMTVFQGNHLSWEKEETKIVSSFKLFEKESLDD